MDSTTLNRGLDFTGWRKVRIGLTCFLVSPTREYAHCVPGKAWVASPKLWDSNMSRSAKPGWDE